MLARLGLRSQDIWAMEIADIDWAAGMLRVSGKRRREVRLPLPQDAGDALLAYFERARHTRPMKASKVFMGTSINCT